MTPLGEWTRCKPWIEAAIKRTPFYEVSDIQDGIESGEYAFWPGQRAAAVTEFIIYPNGKALNVLAGGGESNASLQEFLDTFEPAMVEWAKANECRWVMGFGRVGWDRMLKPRGYRVTWQVLTKDVT